MQSLEVSGAVQPIYGSLGVKRLTVEVCHGLQGKWSLTTEDRAVGVTIVKDRTYLSTVKLS